jgi:hypothetical protein
MLPTNTDLGQAIRRLRRARKLTIETLAFAADMHPTYLSGYVDVRVMPMWGGGVLLVGVIVGVWSA